MKNLISVLLLACGFIQAQDLPQYTPQQEQQAVIKISNLLLSHPESLVSRDLKNWIAEGKVQFSLTNLFPEMVSSEEEGVLLLWYDPIFVLDVPAFFNPADKQAYLQLAIYHEAVHISDHITGKHKLPSMLVQSKGIYSKAQALTIWDQEWSAVTAEWALAKKMGKTHLVPAIYKAVRAGETKWTFLDGFYILMMSGNNIKQNPSLAPIFRARYEAEEAKLRVTKSK